MTIADKLIQLRKQKGWSQEDLAEKLTLSRQSVSKWESGASVPDLANILKLSEIFDVSTDFLLKEHVDFDGPSAQKADISPDKPPASSAPKKEAAPEEMPRSVSRDEADAYLSLARKLSGRFALGVFLLILSPVCLILLAGLSEMEHTFLTENMVAGIGCSVLFLFVAAGVVTLILNGMQLSKYEYLEKENLSLDPAARTLVEAQKEAWEGPHRTLVAIGVALCILSVVPLMLAIIFNPQEFVFTCCAAVLLAIVACGVFFFVKTGTVHESYEKLLQEGDYTPSKKEADNRLSFFPGIYWCLVTTIYLAVSFTQNSWATSWIIWPVAGVFFAALYGILQFIFQKNAKKTE